MLVCMLIVIPSSSDVWVGDTSISLNMKSAVHTTLMKY